VVDVQGVEFILELADVWPNLNVETGGGGCRDCLAQGHQHVGCEMPGVADGVTARLGQARLGRQ
jgi:hypothetical protein